MNRSDSSSGVSQRWLRASAVTALVLLAGYAALVFGAPLDRTQGAIQKILYVHVPCVLAAYVGFVVTAISGVVYLATGRARYDRIAAASAEVGVVFCTLVIVSGPIWARGTWGHWWVWDPRLTVTLLLYFIYLSYLLLRSFTEGSERTARFAAVTGILGAFAIPLNYFAIDLFGGAAMHPENLQSDSLGAGMGAPFATGMVAFLAIFWHLLLARVDLTVRRAAADAAADTALWEAERGTAG